MGLGESKNPFVADGNVTNGVIDKEIGISHPQMLDPRSPSHDFVRTPIYYKTERSKVLELDTEVQIEDPRSPTNGITRTPITLDDNQSNTTVEEVENELLAQMQQLKLFDTPISGTKNSSENLWSDEVIINPKKTALKLLQDEPLNFTENDHPISLLADTPHPQWKSTPKNTPGPDTPVSGNNETDELLKNKKLSSSRKNPRRSQQSNNLQKTVLKKGVADQIPRSPLAERNGPDGIARKSYGRKSSKTTSLIKFKKYSSLEESFSEIFPGKENEEVMW